MARTEAQISAFEKCKAARLAAKERKAAEAAERLNRPPAVSAPPVAPDEPVAEPAAAEPEAESNEPVAEPPSPAYTAPPPVPPPTPAPADSDDEYDYFDASEMVGLLAKQQEALGAQSAAIAALTDEVKGLRSSTSKMSDSFVQHGIIQHMGLNFV